MIKYAVFALAYVLAAAPAAAQADAKPATAPAPKPRFTIDTPIEEIAAHPKGKEVLNTLFPGFTESEFYEAVKAMSLRNFELQVQGLIPPEQMQKVEVELAKL